MGNKEYKTSEEVKQRAEEAIGHTFKEIFELARKYQQEVQERCADVRKLRNIAAASLYSHQDCCGKG